MENEVLDEKPNYYSITPAIVRYDKALSASEKLLYGEISCLTNSSGYCWASNSYFANLYDVEKTTVSGWISKLEKGGHIKTEIGQGNSRKIWINHVIVPIKEKPKAIKEKPKTSSGKAEVNSKSNIKKENTNLLSGDTPEAEVVKVPRKDQHIINVIEAFTLVSPTAATKYAVPAWRKAAEELVAFSGGTDKALAFIKEFVDARSTNMLYLPVVDSLVTMVARYASIRQVLDKEKNKGSTGYNPKGNSGWKYQETTILKNNEKT